MAWMTGINPLAYYSGLLSIIVRPGLRCIVSTSSFSTHHISEHTSELSAMILTTPFLTARLSIALLAIGASALVLDTALVGGIESSLFPAAGSVRPI